MVERFTTLSRSRNEHSKVFYDLALTDELGKSARSQGLVEFKLVFESLGRRLV